MSHTIPEHHKNIAESVSVFDSSDLKTHLDFTLKLLRNLTSLDLLCSRNKPVMRRPLLRRQDHALQELVLLEPVSLAVRIAIIQHDLLDTLVVAQLV